MEDNTKSDTTPEFPIWLTLKRRALEPGEGGEEEEINTLRTTTTLNELLRNKGKNHA